MAVSAESYSYLHFAVGGFDGHAIPNIIPSIRMKTSPQTTNQCSPFMVTTAAQSSYPDRLSFYHRPFSTRMPQGLSDDGEKTKEEPNLKTEYLCEDFDHPCLARSFVF